MMKWLTSQPVELRVGLLTAAAVLALYLIGLPLYYIAAGQQPDLPSAVMQVIPQPFGWGLMAAAVTWVVVRLKRAG